MDNLLDNDVHTQSSVKRVAVPYGEVLGWRRKIYYVDVFRNARSFYAGMKRLRLKAEIGSCSPQASTLLNKRAKLPRLTPETATPQNSFER